MLVNTVGSGHSLWEAPGAENSSHVADHRPHTHLGEVRLCLSTNARELLIEGYSFLHISSLLQSTGKVGFRGQRRHSQVAIRQGVPKALSSKGICDSDLNCRNKIQGTQSSTEDQGNALKPVSHAPHTQT